MTNVDVRADEDLWRRFLACELPEKEWTHRAHLRTAWMYLRRHPLDEAHLLIRVGIIRLNGSHGLIETAARGYHDTLTRVWLALVAEAIAKTPHFTDSSSLLNAHADRLAKTASLTYYSRDRLMSVEARAHFIAPDLAPLP
jgi:hypothetical protein